MDKKLLFALDIGTRSVIGLIGENKGGSIELLASERREHHTRAMLDGQIHDVPEVANVLAEVKKSLEAKHGPLRRVSVAAAGRALCTIRSSGELDVSTRGVLAASDERALELTAIQAAQHQLASSHTVDPTAYYCVGYSVVHFNLDGSRLKTLIGQRGKTANLELIATFLPRQVIDSLQSAIQQVGLEMSTMTLEPIAAINVLIPPTMRHLNLALVDVGAGTSDVAITKDGTVVGYGMVPCAGDEITEALSQRYLLDFNVAEKVKRQLNNVKAKKVSFTDILGMSHKIPTADITASITTQVGDLAQLIATQIMTLNNQPPQAVLLVGGGALTPLLPEAIAQALDIPGPRVAVRCPENVDGIHSIPPELCSPDAVTPLGILKLSAGHSLTFVNVTFNEQPLNLFNLGQLSVSDAMLAAGIDIRSLHGKPGFACTVSVNGKTRFFPGTHGQAGRLLLNGEEAAFQDLIKEGDVLEVVKGEDGAPPVVTVADAVTVPAPLAIEWQGQPCQLSALIQLNGKPVSADTKLTDRDKVTCKLPETLEEVLAALSVDSQPKEYQYQINGSDRSYSLQPTFLHNGQPAQLTDTVKNGDRIAMLSAPAPTVGDVLGLSKVDDESITVFFNGQPCSMPVRRYTFSLNGAAAQPDKEAPDGSQLEFSVSESSMPIISDVLLASRFDPRSLPKTGKVQLLLNGQPAEYTAVVKNGDKVSVTAQDAVVAANA